MASVKSLYYLSTVVGIPVYNAKNVLIGSTTQYRAIARNGKCIGSIELDTGHWVSGFGYLNDSGIRWTKFGTEGRHLFMYSGQFCTNEAG